jgi:streptomycin 6-kinase
MKQLHQAPLRQKGNFSHIKDLMQALDRDWPVPKEYLEKARILKNKLLLSSTNRPILLHGDLHHGNILENDKAFVVIDPKGVIGYPINEVWAFLRDPINDIEYVSNYFGFDRKEVKQWYFVHLILTA